ncbi:MAG: LysR family transcriptional regulator [Actinomycetota bacterium]|nr:MAG: LysR family transcriptional regulator [Actinomycetota bacterium]
MDEARVQLFVNILRHRSLRRAAEETYMTEPTLNNRLRTLERELGVKLLKRTPRGITLTPEGEVFAALAPRLLGTWQDIRKAMNPTPAQDELWIAATPDLASLILPQFLAHLSQTFQKNASGVIVCHPPEMLQGLESGRFNVGLLHSVGNLPNLSSRRLFEDRLILISGEPLPEVPLAAIEEWELFAPVRDYLAWQLIEAFFKERGVWPRSLVHVNHPLVITQTVKQHPGVRGIVAEGMLSNLTLKAMQSPYPVKVTDAQLPALPTYVVWRKDERSQRTTDFVDLLVQFVAARKPSSLPVGG